MNDNIKLEFEFTLDAARIDGYKVVSFCVWSVLYNQYFNRFSLIEHFLTEDILNIPPDFDSSLKYTLVTWLDEYAKYELLKKLVDSLSDFPQEYAETIIFQLEAIVKVIIDNIMETPGAELENSKEDKVLTNREKINSKGVE